MLIKRQKNSSRGFTLVEILVALVITSILATAIYSFFIGQHHAYTVQDQVIEMEQNARAAMDMIRRDLRMAGYHAMGDDLINHLSDFVPSSFIPTSPVTVNLDANPKISEGSGTDPDVITFLSVLPTGNNPTDLSSDVSSGSTQLTLTLNTTQTDDQYNVGDMIHIGTTSEYATIKAISGSTLTIDTNPADTGGNQGVAENYAAGTPIGEIYAVSYAVFNDDNDPSYNKHDPGHPVLKRNANGGGFQPVAENITDMQLRHLGSGEIEVTLSSRTDRADHKFQSNGGYRAYTTSANVKVRNTDTVAVGADCDLPSAPTNVVLTGLNDDYPCQIYINWDEVTGSDGCGVTGYKLYYGTIPGSYQSTIDVGNVTTYTLDDGVILLSECTHYLAVAAINSAGIGPKTVGVGPEAEENIEDNQKPATPTDFNAENINGVERKVAFSWVANNECDLQGYNIYGKSESVDGVAPKINNNIISKEFVNYTDGNFPAPNPGGEIDGCATYYYSIEAVDYCPNVSDLSSQISVSPTAPAPPTNPGFSTDGTTDTLSWVLSSDDFDVDGQNYIVAYKVYDVDTDTVLATLDAGSVNWSTAADVYSNFGVSALDACENESEMVLISSLCGEKPEVSFVSPVDGATVSGVIDIEATVLPSAGRTISSVSLNIENGTDMIDVNQLPYTWDTSLVEDGNYTITIKAYDNMGCEGQEEITVEVSNSDDVEEVIQDLRCKLYGCKAANNSVYLLSYVYDTDESKPVTGAAVSVDIELEGKLYELLPADIFGYYGGTGDVTLPDGCLLQTDGGDSIQESQISSKSKSALPKVNTITAIVQKGEYSTTCSRTFGE
jgi:prepilin-type N-terminal cleavage/methylation domain-containing protein